MEMQEIIEARVRLAGELPSSFVKHLSGMEKNSYAKKRRAKRMQVCQTVQDGTVTLDAKTLEWSQ